MAMQGLFAKGNKASTLSSVPWWSGLGSQPVDYDDHVGQLKSASAVVEIPFHFGSQLATFKEQPEGNQEQGNGKGHTIQFTISPVDQCKTPPDGQKFHLQNTSNKQATAMEHRGHFELGFSQPVICAKYPYGEQSCGVFSTFGPQLTGRIMLPLNSTTDEVPIFVNVKQYHGILRRRQYRAKAMLENKVRNKRKPYLHKSRHLHAMRRPRGCGGRFLNTKSLNVSKVTTDDKGIAKGKLSQATGSQSSEILQSDSENLSSPRESNGCRLNNLSSEVNSVYSRGDLDPFPVNNFCPTIQPLPTMMNAGHGIVLPSKWVAAAESRCNLKV